MLCTNSFPVHLDFLCIRVCLTAGTDAVTSSAPLLGTAMVGQWQLLALPDPAVSAETWHMQQKIVMSHVQSHSHGSPCE